MKRRFWDYYRSRWSSRRKEEEDEHILVVFEVAVEF